MPQTQVLSAEILKVYESVPDLYLILSPELQILTASDAYLAATLTRRQEITGKHMFEAFPDNPETPESNAVSKLNASLQEVLKSRKANKMGLQRYDVPRPAELGGGFEEKYWESLNTPVLDEEGRVLYIIHKVSDVSERMKNLKQIQELADREQEALLQVDWEQKKLHDILMQAPVGIAIYGGKEHIIELLNPLMVETLGRPVQDLLGKPLFEALPEVKGQGFEAILSQVYRTGKPFQAQEIPATLKRAGRSVTGFYKLVYQPLLNADKQVTGIIQISTDVTKQVEARQQLAESEEKYRSLFETMEQGFCILEMIFDAENKPVDYRFLEVNPTFEKHTGLKDAKGKTALELVPNLEKHWFELYGKVALSGQAAHFTQGSEAMGRWFEVNAFRLGGEQSRKVALLFTDATQRKQVEESLKRSNLWFERVNQATQDAIWDWDLNTQEISWNEGIQRMFHYKPEEVDRDASWWEEHVHPEDRERVVKGIHELIDSGREHWAEEYRFLTGDGGYKIVFDRGFAIYDESEKPVRMIGSMQDITELTQAGEDLKKKNEQLKRINNDLDNFIYTASHDLKAPILNIEGLVRLLDQSFQTNTQDQEKIKKLLGLIHTSIGRFKETISDLAEVAKVQNQAEEEVSEIAFDAMLEEVKTHIKSLVEESGVRIEADFSQVPSLHFSRKNLRSIVYNLVSNAIKYRSPDRPPHVKISTSKEEDGHILLSVQDNGLGIKEKDKEKVFMMFKRLNQHVEGTGIGMAIVKKIIDNSEGRIELESEEGKGSIFKIFLRPEKA